MPNNKNEKLYVKSVYPYETGETYRCRRLE